MNDNVYDFHRCYDRVEMIGVQKEGFTGIESTTHYGQKEEDGAISYGGLLSHPWPGTFKINHLKSSSQYSTW